MTEEQKRVFAEMVAEFTAWLAEQKRKEEVIKGEGDEVNNIFSKQNHL